MWSEDKLERGEREKEGQAGEEWGEVEKKEEDKGGGRGTEGGVWGSGGGKLVNRGKEQGSSKRIQVLQYLIDSNILQIYRKHWKRKSLR